MYAVVRNYSGQGASELLDLLEQREEDVRALIGGVPGFVSYVAARSGDGGVTITVCDDKAGTDESSRRAAEWVTENVTATIDAPEITEGNTALQFSS
jgi:FlaG/FlaF family flagellin (archaellin)